MSEGCDKCTMEFIKTKWAEYKAARCWRSLRSGKWTVNFKGPDISGGVTRSEMVKVKDHMDFPEYLERIEK